MSNVDSAISEIKQKLSSLDARIEGIKMNAPKPAAPGKVPTSSGSVDSSAFMSHIDRL